MERASSGWAAPQPRYEVSCLTGWCQSGPASKDALIRCRLEHGTHASIPVLWLRTSSTVTSLWSLPGMTKSPGKRADMAASYLTSG